MSDTYKRRVHVSISAGLEVLITNLPDWNTFRQYFAGLSSSKGQAVGSPLVPLSNGSLHQLDDSFKR